MHILKETEVVEIIKLFNETSLKDAEIAMMYGVSRATINAISNGVRWNHLTEVQDWVNHKQKRKVRVPLTKTEVYEIKTLCYSGLFTRKEISYIYDINQDHIRRIMKGDRHEDVDINKPYSTYKSKI